MRTDFFTEFDNSYSIFFTATFAAVGYLSCGRECILMRFVAKAMSHAIQPLRSVSFLQNKNSYDISVLGIC